MWSCERYNKRMRRFLAAMAEADRRRRERLYPLVDWCALLPEGRYLWFWWAHWLTTLVGLLLCLGMFLGPMFPMLGRLWNAIPEAVRSAYCIVWLICMFAYCLVSPDFADATF